MGVTLAGYEAEWADSVSTDFQQRAQGGLRDTDTLSTVRSYKKASIGVAVSGRPTGPFQYLRSFRPHGQESRDMTLFKASSGCA